MAKNSLQIRTLIEKLDTLSPERVAEVADFVDFLANKDRDNAFGEFLDVAKRVSDAGVPVLTHEEIEAEVKAHRTERRRAPGS